MFRARFWLAVIIASSFIFVACRPSRRPPPSRPITVESLTASPKNLCDGDTAELTARITGDGDPESVIWWANPVSNAEGIDACDGETCRVTARNGAAVTIRASGPSGPPRMEVLTIYSTGEEARPPLVAAGECLGGPVWEIDYPDSEWSPNVKVDTVTNSTQPPATISVWRGGGRPERLGYGESTSAFRGQAFRSRWNFSTVTNACGDLTGGGDPPDIRVDVTLICE